ncbi:MAG: nickel-dependent hydrogenase large subunit [Desulfobacterales bacterium]|nr:nickel-dependent hydrogenase large subunit [Desulfobacterales bacterium]
MDVVSALKADPAKTSQLADSRSSNCAQVRRRATSRTCRSA